MSWLRLDCGIFNDEKVAKISSATFKTWIFLLCAAKTRNGLIENDPQSLAFLFRMKPSKVLQHIRELVAVGLLDELESGYTPHNWDKWQYSSDTSAERSRRWRERHRNVTVTSPDTDTDTEQNTETDTETDERASRVTERICLQADFDRWYETYPRKKGRPNALIKYRAARKKASAEELQAGAERARREYADTEQEFIPYPATFLHQERWRDEDARRPMSREKREIAETMKGVL